MVKNKKLDLLSDEEQDAKELKINKNYAERYDNWRGKEELQRLKDKYGNDAGEDESSSDESEDDDAKELTKDVEVGFFKALSMVKSRDSKIYEKDGCKFFDDIPSDDNEAVPKETKKKDKNGNFYLKDLEREMILNKIDKNDSNIFDDDDDDDNKKKERPVTNKSYFEEQDEIKKSIKAVVGNKSDDDDEGEDGFLKVKSKTNEEKAKEEADYIKWLKGKISKVKNPEIENSMKCLHDYWNDPSLTEGERFLRDFILNKRYLEKEDDDDDDASSIDQEYKPTKTSTEVEKKSADDKQAPLDYVDFSEEEKIIENQEQFERKYNFRYEEPDPEFIKSYPRTIDDSMRRKDTKRKEKREEYRKRKELEKQKKKEELKRLKNLKRKEINDKLEKIKKITGNHDLKLDIDELDKDFDPEEYERKMEQIFNDDYYQQQDLELDQKVDEDGKPIFSDDDEELKNDDWDHWSNSTKRTAESQDEVETESKSKKKKKKRKKGEDSDEEEPDFNMDCDFEEDKKLGKRGKLKDALLKDKPVFDPNEKSFEEYFEEYYKLDCEDVIGGDLPCRFKYREVVPNDFGLEVEEILACKDTELNNWASLKKAIAYRPIQDEIADSKAYKARKANVDLKKKILSSFYNPPEDEEDEPEKEIDEKVEAKPNGTKTEPEKKVKVDEKKDTVKTKEEVKLQETKTNEATSSKSVKEAGQEKHKKDKKKKKNKNILESLTDERLTAYGINPKKFKKKLKYSKPDSSQ